MKISGMTIDTESQYPITQSYSRKETISLGNTSYDTKHTTNSFLDPPQDELEVSVAAITTLHNEQVQAVKSVGTETSESGLSDNDSLKIEILRNLLRLISGKDYDLYASKLNPDTAVDKLKSLINQAQVSIKSNQPLPKQPFELEILVLETHQENEQLTIIAGGVAKTADGQTFDFDVRFNPDQEFIRQINITVPLSLNVHI